MGRERGREPGLPQNSCFISMRLYTAGERVVPGEPPLNCPPLVIQGVDGAQIGTCATNLTQWAWPLAILARWMLSVLRYPPLFHHFFLVLLLSVEVCTGQCLLLSVVLHRSPSAFALSLQIRLGSYKMLPMGHWLWRVPPALCLSHHRTHVSYHGCGWPASQGNEDWALASSGFFAFICTNSPP